MQIKLTKDGSQTLFSDKFGENYHSVNGAVTESLHIFINSGLKFIAKNEISIFELGFGTGLNAILSIDYAKKNNLELHYTGIELYPLDFELISKLNYEILNFNYTDFLKLHKLSWDKTHQFSDKIFVKKVKADFLNYSFENKFDLIFFDAFSPETQSELWTEKVFGKIFDALNNQGILITYSSKGIVKQALRNVGFDVKRLPGPPGKRHILRAVKANQ